MKIGIITGAPQHLSGQTARSARALYALLDQQLFQPVIIRLSEAGNLWETDEYYLYGQARQQERPLSWPSLSDHIDFAWLVLPGPIGEDGSLQEQLQQAGVPYNGLSPKACRYTIDRSRFTELLPLVGALPPPTVKVQREEWAAGSPAQFFEKALAQLSSPLNIRPGFNRGATGQTQLHPQDGLEDFELAVNRAFSREILPVAEWADRSGYDRQEYADLLADAQDGLGLPLEVNFSGAAYTFHDAASLCQFLNDQAAQASTGQWFEIQHLSAQPSDEVLISTLPTGAAFSCLVFQSPEGGPVALPPMASGEHPLTQPGQLTAAAEGLFEALGLQGYAVFEGIEGSDGQPYWLSASSQPKHLAQLLGQATLAGYPPKDGLTALIAASLRARSQEIPGTQAILQSLQLQWAAPPGRAEPSAILFSKEPLFEEGARQLWNALQALGGAPPLLLQKGQGGQWEAIHAGMLFTGAAAQPGNRLQHALASWTGRPPAAEPKGKMSLDALRGCRIWLQLTEEDALLAAAELEELGLPHSSSPASATEICTDRYHALQTLKRNGLNTARQLRIAQAQYHQAPADCLLRVESQLDYPLIGKPAQGHRTQAIVPLPDRAALEAYLALSFRPEGAEAQESRRQLRIPHSQAVPAVAQAVIEQMVLPKGAVWAGYLSATLLGAGRDRYGRHFEWLSMKVRRPAATVLPPEEKYPTAAQSLAPTEAFPSALQAQLMPVLEKGARILNLSGLVELEAWVLQYEDGSQNVIFTDINTCLPFLAGAPYLCPEQPLQLTVGKIAQLLWPEEAATPPLQPEKPTAAPSKKTAMNEPQMPPRAEHPKPHEARNRAEELKAKARVYAQETWAFLKSPIFLKNMGGILLMLAGSFLLIKWSLRWHTHHGESIQIPDFIGMDMEDALLKAEKQNFKLIAIDSFFDSSQRPNSIFQQEPRPNQRAKEGRTIYVSKYRSQADSVLLPTLLDAGYSYLQYRTKAERLDISTSIKERVFDNKQEENSILHFYHNGRKITDDMLRRGVKIPRGATLEFVITERITNEVPLPNLICKRYDEAVFLISSSNLVLGETIGAAGLESQAFVYEQDPGFEPGLMIAKGTKIDLYLMPSRPSGCPDEAPSAPEDANPLNEDGEEDFE